MNSAIKVGEYLVRKRIQDTAKLLTKHWSYSAKIVSNFQLLTIFLKRLISYVQQGPQQVSNINRISLFQEGVIDLIRRLRKKQHFLLTYVYQGVRNVGFSENFAYVLEMNDSQLILARVIFQLLHYTFYLVKPKLDYETKDIINP